MRSTRPFLGACALFFFAACGPSAPAPDASRVVELDVGATCGVAGAAADGARCRCASDCLAGALCLPEATTMFAGGFCSRGCTDTECADGFECVAIGAAGMGGQCRQLCTTSADCGPGRLCRAGRCMPFCMRDSDCDSGVCNDWSGNCLPAGQEPQGAGLREACLRDEDCRSEFCSRAGRCVSSCSIAARSCPEDGVCVGGSDPDADDGLCLRRCGEDGSCPHPDDECFIARIPEAVEVCF